MKNIFRKLILWDFWRLLRRKEGAKFSLNLWYFLNEILSRILKLIVKTLFFPKLKDHESTLIKIAKDHCLEEVFCCLCGSKKCEVMWKKRGFRNVKCSNCGLRFVTPRFTGDGRRCFYSSKYHFLGYPLFNIFNELDFVVNEHLLDDQILNTIIIYKKAGDIIEIGPFGEKFTKKAEKQGFNCWRLRSKGWAYDSPLDEREYRAENGGFSINHKKFDLVSCLDILDRIPDPVGELKSIHGILKNDGILLIRVPNFGSEIAEKSGVTWHHDRPWEKIYQWDYVRLNGLLDKSGFKTVDLKTELSEGVGYVGGIIVVATKKNVMVKKDNPRILVIRDGAAGDVLLTTPIVKELKRKLPGSYVTFMTKYPEILQNNPYVDEIIRFEPKDGVDVVFNLMYELYPDIPIIDAYGKITQLSIKSPNIEFYLSPEEINELDRRMKTLSIGYSKGLAVIHPMSGNRIKRWNGDRYQAVSDYIRSRRLNVVTVGSPMDCVELKGAINLIGKLSLRQSGALISRAKLFVGLDSFPMHVANAFGIPSVILFGSTSPGEVLVDARNVKIVQSSEYCLGCRRHTTPDRWKQNVNCRRVRLYCMENISSDRVIKEIEEMLNFVEQPQGDLVSSI